jgi:hypothetical protein
MPGSAGGLIVPGGETVALNGTPSRLVAMRVVNFPVLGAVFPITGGERR